MDARASDLETVPGATAAALRREGDGGMVFTREKAVEVVEACTAASIAVLGVEIFPSLNVSTYDLFLKNDVPERS